MKNLGRWAVLYSLAMLWLAALAPVAALTSAWMTEEAMRAAFVGKTLDGHYVDGLRWTETYSVDGRLDYSESARKGLGYWYFRGQVFCTFYDLGYGLNGGCWKAVQVSTNCYEFYVAGLRDHRPDEETAPGPLGNWAARAWSKDAPSTCEEKPSV